MTEELQAKIKEITCPRCNGEGRLTSAAPAGFGLAARRVVTYRPCDACGGTGMRRG